VTDLCLSSTGEKGCATYNIATTPDTFTFSAFAVLVKNQGRRNVPWLLPGHKQKLLKNELNFPLPLSFSGSDFGGELSGQAAGGRSILTSTERCLMLKFTNRRSIWSCLQDT